MRRYSDRFALRAVHRCEQAGLDNNDVFPERPLPRSNELSVDNNDVCETPVIPHIDSGFHQPLRE